MSQKELLMLDRPTNPMIASGIGYNIIAFFGFPFILILAMQGSYGNIATISLLEIIYHIVNFIAALMIFGHYLPDSFLGIAVDPKGFWSVVLKSVLLILGISVVLFYADLYLLNEYADLGAFGILPILEIDLLIVPSYLVETNPVFGTACVVLLGPLTASCLYYAAVFAPIANNRPILAYFVAAAFIALPRAFNALCYHPPIEELILYFMQLPVHLLACRAYHKADTVWAPIAVLTIVNIIASAAMLIMLALT